MNRKVSAWWRRTTGAAFALGLLAVAGLPLQGAWAQGVQGEAAPRMRVIIDNDFSGDPDGLFQLAHHLLSPSVFNLSRIALWQVPRDAYRQCIYSMAEVRTNMEAKMNH